MTFEKSAEVLKSTKIDIIKIFKNFILIISLDYNNYQTTPIPSIAKLFFLGEVLNKVVLNRKNYKNESNSISTLIIIAVGCFS